MIGLLLALSLLPAQDGGKITWRGKGESNVVPTYLAAKKEGRPFFLFFTSEGNEDCIALSSGAFSNPDVVEASAKFTCIYMECSGGKNAGSVTDFKITKYPTICFLDPDGNALGEVRERDAATILKVFRQVAEKVAMLPPFPENIDGALNAARQAGLPLLVYFYDDSLATLAMNKSIQDAEIKPLRERFFYARWPFKRGSETCRKYDVDRAPTILILDPRLPKPEEKPIDRIVGSRSPRELRRDLDAALGTQPGKPGDTPAVPSTLPLPTPKEKLSDDEIDRKFIRARIGVATDLLKREKVKEAVDVLEDVVQTWPKHVETLEARKLLDQIQKK